MGTLMLVRVFRDDVFRVIRGSFFCSLKNGSTNCTNNTKRAEFDFAAFGVF